MIKAGSSTIQDKGFTVAAQRVGGVSRQVISLELPGGIDEATLAALCAGPIEVQDEAGQTVQKHEGPFRLVSHGLKLTRASEAEDVAALTAQVEELEAALDLEKSAKQSAQDALASLKERFQALAEKYTTGQVSHSVETGKATAEAAHADGGV